MSAESVVTSRPVALVDVLDRLLNVGVVLQGDLMLSVAEVDLLYVGLKLVICSVDRLGLPPYEERLVRPPAPFPAPPALALAAHAQAEAPAAMPSEAPAQPPAPQAEPRPLPPLPPQDPPPNSARGLAQLVLALVELLRELMERQAIQRMERGTIDEAQLERLGQAFQSISQRMDELKAFFDLNDDDLNLDLGPLGRLLD
jgi:hypothetical protein